MNRGTFDCLGLRSSARQNMRHEIYSLTSLRGLAAIWVLLVHFQEVYKPLFPSLSSMDPWVHQGPQAVTLFFILSGYVIGMSYFERMSQPTSKQVLRFISLRFARIYPVHLFTLLGLLAAAWNDGWPKPSSLSPASFVENLLLVQSWPPHPVSSWNYPAWSISSEWFVYCICPLIFMVLHRFKSNHARWAALLLCIVGTGLIKQLGSGLFPGIIPTIPAFVGGILLSCLFPPTSRMQPKPNLIILFAGLIFLIPFLIKNQTVIALIFSAIFFATIAILGSGDSNSISILSSPYIIYLGEISYSLYLTHVPTLTAISGVVGNQWIKDIPHYSIAMRSGILAGYVASIFIVAIATHWFIEKPARNWLRIWIPRMIPD
jgi:peptidoglycan/LPS O-acetylase OafA/YrhL